MTKFLHVDELKHPMTNIGHKCSNFFSHVLIHLNFFSLIKLMYRKRERERERERDIERERVNSYY
jgi:hypothetical protein